MRKHSAKNCALGAFYVLKFRYTNGFLYFCRDILVKKQLFILRMHNLVAFCKGVAIALCVVVNIVCCREPVAHNDVDHLNTRAYEQHYRSLQHTTQLAREALKKATHYSAGRAEAYNHLAFVEIAKMNYPTAHQYLQQALQATDNLVEQMVAEVQLMRLCQRQSLNKDFYIHMEAASQLKSRIKEEADALNEHQKARFVYAETEFYIVASTYYYYVGLENEGQRMLACIDARGEILTDVQQQLDYYYNIGAGGILHGKDKLKIGQDEFQFLIRCYLLARQYNIPFWEANALQAMSEHLQDKQLYAHLLQQNKQEISFINADNMPDSLLAGNLALRAGQLFHAYGDVYQEAGAYRTLAQSYWDINDYQSALICLHHALNDNKRVENAPDLAASICEKLSLAYAAINNKQQSDHYRNVYLDLQENTRQDRMLEARAEQLGQSVMQLNIMIAIVCLLTLVVVAFMVWLYVKRNDKKEAWTDETCCEPLCRWQEKWKDSAAQDAEKQEETEEEIAVTERQLSEYKRVNIEQRAKVSLVNNILPLINRIVHETQKMKQGNDDEKTKAERCQYIIELTQKIDQYNNALTAWIKMRQGKLMLRIESFGIQELFDILAHSKTEFALKQVALKIVASDHVVKADKVLTLFMLNTMLENARKHTPQGGCVTVNSIATDQYIEISVCDNGEGMNQEQVAQLFMNKVITDEAMPGNSADRQQRDDVKQQSHGFGLMNCKGIIEKYKKTSARFNVCHIGVESQKGVGTRIFFRLPKGIKRAFMALMLCSSMCTYAAQGDNVWVVRASQYADSAYFSNVAERYRDALRYADSCRLCLNSYYKTLYPKSELLLQPYDNDASMAAELLWFNNKVPVNFNIILDMRNESAVAALALHEWDVYQYNNKVYTRLFNASSADSSLPDYVKMMKKMETNKNVAIILLVLLLLGIIPAYYFLYYRYRLYYRYGVDRVKQINEVLLSDIRLDDKLSQINQLWGPLPNMSRNNKLLLQLDNIVKRITSALEAAITEQNARKEKMVLACDKLQRLRYEKDNVYISNNVLDNCLSTLKHETMYYPSRIMQLVDDADKNLDAINEIAKYYQKLFGVLSEQALRQIHIGPLIDYELLSDVLTMIRRMAGDDKLSFTVTPMPNNKYVMLTTCISTLPLTSQQLSELFTPATIDFRWLICRQIIRECGELTNARGCGIQARRADDNNTIIEIIITSKIWKNSKLS